MQNKSLAFIIWSWIILTGFSLSACASATTQSAITGSQSVDVLLFTKTEGFRHDIIEFGSEVIEGLGDSGGFSVTATEDASVFTEEGLAGYKAIIFFNTSNDVLNEQQKVAFQEYIRGGGGFVGIHQGITTHQNWDWFLDMVGGGLKFGGHPEIQPGTLLVEDHDHPSTSHLSEEWTLRDEFYDFTVNPRDITNVLLSLDESTYSGGTMGKDHPYAWYHTFEGGRVWCTGLGHTEEVLRDENYHKHLIGGIRWAAGLEGPTASELAVDADWWSSRHSVRIPITVGAKEYTRFDIPAEVEIDLAEVLNDENIRGSFDANSLRLIEINAQGEVLDESVPFQYDPNDKSRPLAETSGNLVFNLQGITPENSARRYHLYLGMDTDGNTVFTPPSFTQQIVITDEIFHRDQESYKITTRDALGKPNTTYYYHKFGGGFASMYDSDGNDWIDYSPGGGDQGEWRGIPNLGWNNWEWENPDDDPGFGHPDYATGQSEIVHRGPLKTTIRSWSNNELWETYWEIYSSFARLTVTKVPDREYWFLYEGPPGGKFDDSDYFIRDDGSLSPIDEDWAGDLQWGYFSSKKANRSLYLIHEDFDDVEDSYWKLRTMTVFGFGRGSGDNRMSPLLTETPNRFIIGFTDGTEFSRVSQMVESTINTLSYRVGPPEIHESIK